MKKRLICGAVVLAAGVVMLLLPLHVAMTGLVLLMLGAAIMLTGLLLQKPSKGRQTAVYILTVLAAAGVVVLMAAMNLITTSGQSDWKQAKKSDYAIVLGAGVHANGAPSRVLRSRLNATMDFLERNPGAMVILSGGQGSDEPMSEAQCMYNTLLSLGADASRLIMEPESSTTRENLQNSWEIIEGNGGTAQPVTLITSEFHQRRAKYIADSLDIDTCPVSGRTDQWFLRVNYTLREVFSFVKAFFQNDTA